MLVFLVWKIYLCIIYSIIIKYSNSKFGFVKILETNLKANRIKLSVADRQEIVLLYNDNVPVTTLAKKFGVSASSIYNYIRLDHPHESSNKNMKISFRQVISKEAELVRLRQENEILKSYNCYRAMPQSERLQTIACLADRYSIHVLCRTLNVLRSTYYHHSLRAPDQTQYEKADAQIKPLVKHIFEVSKGRYGTRKLKTILEIQGHAVSLKRLRRLMRELNLECKQKQLKYFSSSNRKYLYRRNTLKQQFLQIAPNLVWASDITYIRVAKDFYAIYVIIDLFSRKVIAYDISITNDANLVIKVFKQAFEKRNRPEGLLFHSDQGVQ